MQSPYEIHGHQNLIISFSCTITLYRFCTCLVKIHLLVEKKSCSQGCILLFYMISPWPSFQGWWPKDHIIKLIIAFPYNIYDAIYMQVCVNVNHCFLYACLVKINSLFNPYKPSVLFMGHWQTVQIQIRYHIMRFLIRNFTVCLQNLLLKFGKKITTQYP